MTAQAVRVLCVDDNEFVAESTRRRLTVDGRFEWAGWLPSAAGLAEHAAAVRPHVVLLDIDMPGPDPFELMAELARAMPQVRVVMFSAYVRGDLIDRAVECGAWGYISKNEAIDDILKAIEQVAAGQFALSHDAAAEQQRIAKGRVA